LLTSRIARRESVSTTTWLAFSATEYRRLTRTIDLVRGVPRGFLPAVTAVGVLRLRCSIAAILSVPEHGPPVQRSPS
jgi:hypothetical protein